MIEPAEIAVRERLDEDAVRATFALEVALTRRLQRGASTEKLLELVDAGQDRFLRACGNERGSWERLTVELAVSETLDLDQLERPSAPASRNGV